MVDLWPHTLWFSPTVCYRKSPSLVAKSTISMWSIVSAAISGVGKCPMTWEYKGHHPK